MIPVKPIEKVPLRTDDDGVVRLGQTRVTLDTVISDFQDGATAEEIAHQYPSLDLGDIYSVIGYFLRHRAEVEEYLRRRSEESLEVRKQTETRFDPNGIRDRLLSRTPNGSK